MRIAFLADIHGNLPALQAVTKKLELLQPDAVIVVGDSINAVPFSSHVLDFIHAADWRVLRGNHEFYYLDYISKRAPDAFFDPKRWGQIHWLAQHLRPEQAAYLATLPDELTLHFPGAQPLRTTHGVPGNNRRGFSNRTAEETIAYHLKEVPQITFVNAHSHFQIDRFISKQPQEDIEPSNDPADFMKESQHSQPRQWHLVNPGSVGLPQNGDVRAQFAILESVSPQAIPGGWRVSHYRIAYDRRPALEAYHSSGMLAAGGVISEVFYWELVTAEREIPFFFHWLRSHDPERTLSIQDAFNAYKEATGREAYVRQRDPLRRG